MHVFKGIDEAVVAINLFRDPIDQLDLVCMYLRAQDQHADETSTLLNRFFGEAKVQVHFSRNAVSTRLREATDEARFPLMVAGGTQAQRYVAHNEA